MSLSAGTVDANATILSGSGLSTATAGEEAGFTVKLFDSNGRASSSHPSSVSAVMVKQGTEGPNSFKLSWKEELDSASSSSGGSTNVSMVEGSPGEFEVRYSISEAGVYDLHVFWTNILLNRGQPIRVAVLPGSVEVTSCSCYKLGYNNETQIQKWNYIHVIVNDHFGNGVTGKSDYLQLSITTNVGGYDIENTIDHLNGSYIMGYRSYVVGSYTIDILYDGTGIPSCQFNDFAHSDGYFPKANNDHIDVMQGNIASINVLSNDSGGKIPRKLMNVTKNPLHGQCIVDEQRIIYIPIQGYTGDDTFTYLIQDWNTNFAYGDVSIKVIPNPPNILIPFGFIKDLEDTPTCFNWNGTGVSVEYWNETSELSVSVRAQNGALYLAADAPLRWHFPEAASPSTGSPSLTFTGSLAAVNSALQALLYVGDANFNGNDPIAIFVADEYGASVNGSIVVTILPVNDPPFIYAPFKALLDPSGFLSHGFYENGSLVPSDSGLITVGDPDEYDMREDMEELEVEILLRVDSGAVSITLPRNATDHLTTFQGSSEQWVAPSLIQEDFAVISGEGIRFRATINDSNVALKTLQYNGGSNEATLTIIINDLGSWGCSWDCKSNVSIPLLEEARIVLSFTLRSHAHSEQWKKRVIMASILTIMAIIGGFLILVALPCFIVKLDIHNHMHHATLKKFDDATLMSEELKFQSSRAYNPIWIPSTSGDGPIQYHSTTNPIAFNLRRAEFRKWMALAKEDTSTVKK